MPFVNCDADRTWVADDRMHHCPQVPQIVSTDTPYLMFDFSAVVAENERVTSADAVIEKDSQTITVADTSVSNDGKRVSFKVSGMAAGTYVMRSTVQLSHGTTNKISRQGTLKVS